MSDSNGPIRRRRIAGEGKPAAPAAPARKPAKKVVARKARTKAPVKTPEKPPAAAPDKTPAKAPVKTPAKRAAVVTKDATPRSGVATAVKRERAGGRPSRRDLAWLLPTGLLAIAAVVVGALLLVRGLDSEGGAGDFDTAQRQASSAAASAAETIFSFQYDQLDDHLEASKALMTPGFAEDFDKIAPALTELAPQRQIQVQAVSREAAALPCGDECSSSKVDVLVFVDQARLVGGSDQPTVFANRISVSMVESDDGWLVSNIRAL